MGSVFAGLLELIFVRLGFIVLTGLLVCTIRYLAKFANISQDWQWLVFILVNFAFLILVDLRRAFILGSEKFDDGEVTALAFYSYIVSALTLFLC